LTRYAVILNTRALYTVIYVYLYFIYTKNRRIECLTAEKIKQITIHHNNVLLFDVIIMPIIIVYARPTQRNPSVAAQKLTAVMLRATYDKIISILDSKRIDEYCIDFTAICVFIIFVTEDTYFSRIILRSPSIFTMVPYGKYFTFGRKHAKMCLVSGN